MQDTSKKKKVLVIDDNIGVLFIIQKALEVKNYEVKTLDTFLSLEGIEKINPDLIFLDVALAGADGCIISQELKRNKTTRHIPIIMLTGYSDAKNLAEEAGADDYITKPFELANLWEITVKHTADK